jgi:chaperonin GroEL
MEEIIRDKTKIISGINKLADAVLVTMGPNGKTVMITDFQGRPYVTKDGVSVSNYIELRDPIENAAATLVKEVAQKTLEQAGDGTTTATCFAKEFINIGFKLLELGVSYNDIKSNLDTLEEVLLGEIIKSSKELTQDKIYSLALIASNNDVKIAKLISEAYSHSNLVKVEESSDEADHLEVINGMQVEGSIFDKAFINNGKKQAIDYDKCKLVIVDGKINTLTQLTTELKGTQALPIIIIADHFSEEALNILKDNYNRGALEIGLLKSPGFGGYRRDLIQDIIKYTGARKTTTDTVYTTTIDKVFADKHKIVLSNNSPDIDTLLDDLKDAISIEKDPAAKGLLTRRIENLNNDMCIIYTGGNSELEKKERKDRMDDAVLTVKSGLEEGIVKGAGHCFKDIYDKLNYTKTPMIELSQAILGPYNKINIPTINNDIIDSAKVLRCALQNALSVCKTILSMELAIINDRLWK